MPTLAFWAAKGGAGTTTMAAGVAAARSEHGRTVAVDLDPSAGLTHLLDEATLDPDAPAFERRERDDFDLVPAGRRVTALDALDEQATPVVEDGPDPAAVERLLADLEAEYDVVVLDLSLLSADSPGTARAYLDPADAAIGVTDPRSIDGEAEQLGAVAGAAEGFVGLLRNKVESRHSELGDLPGEFDATAAVKHLHAFERIAENTDESRTAARRVDHAVASLSPTILDE